jgi:plasmid maintenance system antidote protein VapI
MVTATFAPATRPPVVPTQPDPEAVRDHIRQLHEDGGSYNGIAAAVGLDSRTVRDLISGRRPVTPYTTKVLLAVTTATLPRNRVDAGGTRLRLRALHVMGHGSPRIARAAGAGAKTIRRLVRGDATTITPQLRDAITAVYDAWWDKRAPARTPAERGAATAARKRAIAGDWCAAAALDDDLLDTLGYQPAWGWKPATGTGTAPDIHPSVLQQKRTGIWPTTNV